MAGGWCPLARAARSEEEARWEPDFPAGGLGLAGGARQHAALSSARRPRSREMADGRGWEIKGEAVLDWPCLVGSADCGPDGWTAQNFMEDPS